MGNNSQWGVVDVVNYLHGFGLVGKSQYLTLVRIEFHFVFFFPRSEGVEVALEWFGVICVLNGPVQKATVCK